MGDGVKGEVFDEGFFRRYRELLDAENIAFDELEHASEEGDRATYDTDLATWKAALERRTAFLDRHLAAPVTTG
jgi:hypothetical protein